MAAGKQPKGKKRWFTVLAPALFGSRELVEIPAYMPEELQKRFVGEVKLSYRLFTRDSTGKELYRLNALFRMIPYAKGQKIIYRGDEVRILSVMQNGLRVQNIKTGRKFVVKFRDLVI